MHRGATVVRTARLAAVAAENPAVKVDAGGGLSFDGVAGDAAGGRYHPFVLQNRPRGTGLDAGATRTAPDPLHRLVVVVKLLIDNQFAKMHETAVAGRNEERLPTYPPETRLDGPPLLGHGGRIDKAASRKGWASAFERTE